MSKRGYMMDNSEKNSIYSSLNLIDFLESMEFVSLDSFKIDKLR